MTFLKKLKAHVGGLVLIKTELYWYKTRKWDGAHESVHLLLDVLDPAEDVAGDISPEAAARWTCPIEAASPIAVLLFIDGSPKWVWIYHVAVELLK